MMTQPVEEQNRLPHTQMEIDMNNAVYLCLCVYPENEQCKPVREAVRQMQEDMQKQSKGY